MCCGVCYALCDGSGCVVWLCTLWCCVVVFSQGARDCALYVLPLQECALKAGGGAHGLLHYPALIIDTAIHAVMLCT
jgi:hypothetical protein